MNLKLNEKIRLYKYGNLIYQFKTSLNNNNFKFE